MRHTLGGLAMGQFIKGIQTKQMLYDTAKRLFYEKGYADTTVKDIVSEAGAKLGTFTYHYSSKESLAADIYRSFIYELNKVISQTLSEVQKECAPLTREVTEYRAFFKAITSSSHIRQFYIDICDTLSFKDISYSMNRQYISNCISLEPICEEQFDLVKLDALTSMVSGMEVRYLYDLFLNRLSYSDLEQAIDTFLYYYYGFFINHKDLLNQVIMESRTISSKIEIEIEIEGDFAVRRRMAERTE